MTARYRKLLFWSVELLVVALLIWVCSKIDFVFRPLAIFISVVFMPLVISMFLFYMTSPVFKLLLKVRIGRFKMSRGVASFIIVFGLIVLILGGIMCLIPPVVNELSSFIKWLPTGTREVQDFINNLVAAHPQLKSIDLSTYYKQFNHQITNYLQSALKVLTSSATSIIGTVSNAVVTAVTVPVMLFYMLKDGNRFVPAIKRYLSPRYGEKAGELLEQMNKTLSSYISGQVVECIFVAVATGIGYLIIGQPMAVVLAVIAGITNIIPYIGPYIGIAPALLVALSKGMWQMVWVIVVVVIVQQLDGNIIYPNIIGKSLNIHPLTIILLLLAAGNIAGLAGMILCVPFYAVVKTIFNYFWSIYQLGQEEKQGTNEAREET